MIKNCDKKIMVYLTIDDMTLIDKLSNRYAMTKSNVLRFAFRQYVEKLMEKEP